ncbi:hypothetical protein MBLNU230_g7077t1 [Neophaeotheca triangularis]
MSSSSAANTNSGKETAMPLNKSDQEHVRAMNAMIDRIRPVLPEHPYVLTIPHEDNTPRYHHPPADKNPYPRNQWLQETPFLPGEHNDAQYLTYAIHEQGAEETQLFKQVPSYVAKAAKKSPGTPANGMPKKKISLEDYRNKKAAAEGASPAKGEVGKEEKVERKAKTSGVAKERMGEANGEGLKGSGREGVSGGDLKAGAAVPGQGTKRKREDDDGQSGVKGESDKFRREMENKRARVEKAEKEAKMEAQVTNSGHDASPPKSPAFTKHTTSETQKEAARGRPSRGGAPPVHADDHQVADPRPSPRMQKAADSPAPRGPSESARGEHLPAKDRVDSTLPPKLSPLHASAEVKDDRSQLVEKGESKGMAASKGEEKSEEEGLHLKGGASEDSGVLALPGLLSPNLPPDIEKAIKEAEGAKAVKTAENTPNSSAPNSASKSGDRPSTKSVAAKHVSSKPKNGFRAGTDSPSDSPAPADVVEKRKVQAPTSAVKRASSPKRSYGEESGAEKASAGDKPATSKIVKLKFRRDRRETLARILRMPPKRQKERSSNIEHDAESTAKKTAERQGGSTKRDANSKGVAQKIGPPPKVKPAEKKQTESKQEKQSEAKQATATKRPRPADDQSEQPAKRKKPDPIEKVKERETSITSRSSEPARSSQIVTKRPSAVEDLKQEPKTSGSNDSADAAPKKRPKIETPNLKDPSTPTAADHPTPSAVSSAQKSQQATPSARRDLPTNTKPEHPRESSAANTAASDLPKTPTANSSSSQPASTTKPSHPPTSTPSQPHPTNSNANPVAQAWATEQTRLQTLGRELKHTASDHLTKSKQPSTSATNPNPNSTHHTTLAALHSLEALLTFVLAFHAADRFATTSQPPLPPPLKLWRSLQGFLPFVKNFTRPFPKLAAIAAGVGVVGSWHFLRLASGKEGGLAKSEVGRAVGGVEGVLEVCGNVEVLRREVEAGLLGGEAGWEGSFPRTWAGRSLKGDVGVDVDGEPGGYEGGFGLPLGVGTEPLVAVRVGVRVIEEWVRGLGEEGVGYQMRLKL